MENVHKANCVETKITLIVRLNASSATGVTQHPILSWRRCYRFHSCSLHYARLFPLLTLKNCLLRSEYHISHLGITESISYSLVIGKRFHWRYQVVLTGPARNTIRSLGRLLRDDAFESRHQRGRQHRCLI